VIAAKPDAEQISIACQGHEAYQARDPMKSTHQPRLLGILHVVALLVHMHACAACAFMTAAKRGQRLAILDLSCVSEYGKPCNGGCMDKNYTIIVQHILGWHRDLLIQPEPAKMVDLSPRHFNSLSIMATNTPYSCAPLHS